MQAQISASEVAAALRGGKHSLAGESVNNKIADLIREIGELQTKVRIDDTRRG
jgi:hypothetical protein